MFSKAEGTVRVFIKSKTLLARRLFLPVGRGKKRKLGYQKVAKSLFDTPYPHLKRAMGRTVA
jgi:hypothetical protein